MVEEEPFVVIAEGVDIIESRELAPLQKRLERLSDQDAAVVFIGVYEDDYPHKQEAVPFSNLMDVIISVPEPDTARKREILQETLSSKATDLDISVDLSQLDCEVVAEDASALDAYRLQKVVDRAFMIAQTEATTEVSQSHMETAVEQVTEEQSEITADNERHRRQSGSDFETESPDVSFNDVGGLEDVINRIQSVVSIQEEYADIYEQTGFETSHGMLLAGPPGTGKTLLAKAVANELDRTFLSVKGAEMRNPWFGRTEQIIRELFEKADDEAPSVLFFDEFDALAGKRSKSSRSVNQSIVATLLTELDGMESQDDVLVIAATNRKDAIDEALLRPGRLDETITVPVPDEDGQAQIFDIHTDGLPTADDVTGEWFTQQVTALTGAQIRQVCEETFRKAVQREENPEQLTLNTTDFRSVIESLNHTSSIDMQERPIGYE
jgi:transitional endoplasmic reticulum ATPase